MTQPRIKVLVIGAAFSADLHMEGYQRCSDLARVVGICDMQPDRIDALGQSLPTGRLYEIQQL